MYEATGKKDKELREWLPEEWVDEVGLEAKKVEKREADEGKRQGKDERKVAKGNAWMRE